MSDELIVRHCAPTLAGLKTGNLFVVKVGCEEAFRRRLRELNRTLASKGLRVIPVKRTESKAWVYVYRPSRLKRDLDDSLAREILPSSLPLILLCAVLLFAIVSNCHDFAKSLPYNSKHGKIRLPN